MFRIKRGKFLLVAVIYMILSGIADVNMVMADSLSIQTTLSDGAIQRGSRKTFDVWARDENGNKVSSAVTLNGIPVSSTWDDSDKTSYTLSFDKAGANTVVVSAGTDGKTSTVSYSILYQKANTGDCIGQSVWSVELNTIGCGYLVEPTHVNILEGETAAQVLVRFLHEKGYAAYYGGNPQKGFYLAYIADGDKTGGSYNGYILSGTPANKRKLDLNPAIPDVLYSNLQKTMTFFDDTDYDKNWKGYIGEFVFTNGSGWMYSINNIFPNVGFSDSFLSDGDVVRVQFTLAYGADIGGTSVMGADSPSDINLPEKGFYTVANKDELTKLIAEVNDSGRKNESVIKAAYQDAVNTAGLVNTTQESVNAAYTALKKAYTAGNAGSSVISGKSELPIVSTENNESGRTGACVAVPSADRAARSNSDSTVSQGSEETVPAAAKISESEQTISSEAAVTVAAVLAESNSPGLKKRDLSKYLLQDLKKNNKKEESVRKKDNYIQEAIGGITGSILLMGVILIIYKKKEKGEKK